MRYQQSWDDLPPEKIEEPNQRNVEATILRSLELGINHIETARAYGTSEMQLGWILPKLPREKMIVQTKVAPFATPEEFLATFETSMRYLKLEHVDLLSFHGINQRELLHWTLRKGGCLEAARQLQRDGRCRFIGFSTHATTDLILEAVNTGEFDYFNVHWYFVNELNWPAIEAAARHDMGVFIISPTDKGGMLYEPPAKLVELSRPLSPIQANDLFCLARPQVQTLSLGAAKPGDFDEHIAALDHYETAAGTIAPIEARWRSEMASVHGEDWCARWSENLPSYVDLPGEVNVQEIVRLWNYAKALDLVGWGKMRYNLMGNAGHWFPGANAAEFNEPALRAALKNYPFADRIPPILREAHHLLHAQPKKRLSEGG
jgi:predicted aldo/keto reductase-like oxidoreductase